MSRRSRKSVSLICQSVRYSLPIEPLEERKLLSLLGQQLYPSDYPWNQNISQAPVASNSNAVMNNIVASQGTKAQVLHPDFGQDTKSANTILPGIPYNVVHGNSTPKVSVTIDGGESDVLPAPILSNFVIEGDYETGPSTFAQRGDGHMLVWDEDNNIAYEFYQTSRPSDNTDGKWHAVGETVWYMNTDQFRTIGWTSVDAAGLSVLAGLARPDEGLPVSQGGQGVITHAIRFTLTNSIILNEYIYPASHRANTNTNLTINPPMGSRFRLKSSVNIAGMDPQSKIVAQALQTYGMILADNGSNFFITGASYSVDANNGFVSTWNTNDINDTSHGLKSLPFSDFEMVNLTPIVTAVSPSTGSAGQTITITGLNFSGAAGHLSVLFGSTPSPSVTVLNDSQVTAVAPSGLTGLYDVTVKSGVPDIGDNENFNNPTFGYGTSATSLADRFTFATASTVSGRVFQDNNADGAFNGADTGLNGQTVYLDENNNGGLDSGEPSTASNSSGNYTFTGVSAGISGTVRLQSQPSGYVLDNSSSNGFTTTSGGTSTVNLGYFPSTYTGTSGSDTYNLVLDGTGANINVLLGGVLTYSAPKTLAASLTFNLAAGAGSVTVDSTNGNPIPSGGVTVTGGASADSLIVSAPVNNNAVTVNGAQVTVNGSTVNYSSLAALTVNTGAGNDSLTQLAQPGNGASLAFNNGTGSDSLIVTGGTFAIPSNPTGNLSVTVGGSGTAAVTFTGNASGIHGIDAYSLASLTVNTNGTATLSAAASGLTADRTLLTTNSLSVTGSVNVMGNSIDVHYGSGSDPFSTIRGNVIGGQITSSLNDAFHAVGYADGTDGIVKSISSGDILIRYTAMGDANLDGTTGFADLSKVAQNYNATNTTWDTGDFMGTGTTSFTDLVKVAQNYNASLTSTQVGAGPAASTLS